MKTTDPSEETSSKPKFQHDCNHCVFLGRFKSERVSGKEIDVYWCSSTVMESLSSIVGRYGNAGQHYVCGHPPEAFADPFGYYDTVDYVRFACERAKALGLYHGRFGQPDDRIQAVRRLKAKFEIPLQSDKMVLKIGTHMRDYRQLFLVDEKHDARKIDWKEALKFVKRNYAR